MFRSILCWFRGNQEQRKKLRVIATIRIDLEENKSGLVYCKANCNGERCISFSPQISSIESIQKTFPYEHVIREWQLGNIPHKSIRYYETLINKRIQ